jgi:predicted Zn-dependent protease with MMP-like domain
MAVTPSPGAHCAIVSWRTLRGQEDTPVQEVCVTLRVVRPADSRPPRVRRRDRHGRGLRGPLAPAGSPLQRSRAERFDDLVLQALAHLEPRWESELASVEFAVEEVPTAPAAGPPSPDLLSDDSDPVPLARLDRAWTDPGDPARPARPARIVLYRRPLLARADGEDELGELVLDVVIEEFAWLLGLDPQVIDPDYPDDD